MTRMLSPNDKIILEFPCLYQGWECDPKGWVMENEEGGIYLELTSHGSHYKGVPEELEELIQSYEDTITQTQKALSLLKGV